MKLSYLSAMLGLSLLSTNVIADEEKEFSMDGELGFVITTGNTETTSANAALNAKQELTNWSNEYALNGLYKKDEIDGVKTTSERKFFASAQGNYKLENPNHRLFGFASYEDKLGSGFDYQATIAGGWNQKVWKTADSEFNYSIGPGYSFQKITDGEDADGFVVRGSFNYKYSISDTAKFTQTFSTEIGSDNTKSRAESAVSAKLVGNLSMKVGVIFDHNSDVSEGTDKLDTTTSVNLVYTFF